MQKINLFTDKNMDAVDADKNGRNLRMQTSTGGHKNLFKISKEELKQFITEIQNKLKRIVDSHMYKENCTKKEAEFLMSKMFIYEIPHFYIIWKIRKKKQSWDDPL